MNLVHETTGLAGEVQKEGRLEEAIIRKGDNEKKKELGCENVVVITVKNNVLHGLDRRMLVFRRKEI